MVNNILIGIVPPPFINKTKFHNLSKNLFFTTNILKSLKNNNIDFIIIPYNIKICEFKNIIENLNGLIFTGSQLGNYYNNQEFKKHYIFQKYILSLGKKINKYKYFPIFGICHGYQNMIMIESKKNIYENKNIFISVKAYKNYKNKLIFRNNKQKNFSKTKKLNEPVIHNNSLGVTPYTFNKLKLNKNLYIVATNVDKNNVEFIDIIKYKKYPFYGFQFHPELSNDKLLIDLIINKPNKSNKSNISIKLNDNKKINKNNQTNKKILKKLKLKTKKNMKYYDCDKIKVKINKNSQCLLYKI